MSSHNEAGKQRDSERTKRKIYNAVGEILRTEGYKGLGMNNIARYADVHKKLIYRYFIGHQELIETYVLEKDYWVKSSGKIVEMVKANNNNVGKELAGNILEEQLEYFYKDAELQNIILWEISGKNPLMQKISRYRERIGAELFQYTDARFQGSPVNIRAIEAILISGIYYLVLHAKSNGSTFCELDINKEADKREIVKALKQLVGWAFDAAEKKQ